MIYSIFLSSPIMWLLTFLSVITLAVILERFFFLKGIKVNREQVVGEIKNILSPVLMPKRVQHAREYCASLEKTDPLCAVVKVILQDENIYLERDQLKKIVDLEIQKRSIPLERRFTILNTSTSISPLLGLLGTVIGMIRSFVTLSEGSQDSVNLAGGISEALITTAFGLGITIPGIIAYNFFVRKVNKVMDDMEIGSFEIIDFLKQK